MSLFTKKRKKQTALLKPNITSIRVDRSLSQARLDSLKQLYSICMELPMGWEKQVFSEIKTLVSCCKVLKESSASGGIYPNFLKVPDRPLVYIISSIFVIEVFDFLVSDSLGREELVLLTGPIAPDGTRTLSQIIHVEKDIQTIAHVQASDSTHSIIIDLIKKYGHRPLGNAHSHPMGGIEGTRPSSVDITHQNNLVAIKDDSIAIIVNRDGYIRVYSTWKPFEFNIFGKGIEEIDNTPKMKLFRLTQHKQEQNHAPSQICTDRINKEDNHSKTNVQNQTPTKGEAE